MPLQRHLTSKPNLPHEIVKIFARPQGRSWVGPRSTGDRLPAHAEGTWSRILFPVDYEGNDRTRVPGKGVPSRATAVSSPCCAPPGTCPPDRVLPCTQENMRSFAFLALAGLGLSAAFVPATVPSASRSRLSMALDVELTKTYPRDFKAIPLGTSYGE